jgi:hypothetical protein
LAPWLDRRVGSTLTWTECIRYVRHCAACVSGSLMAITPQTFCHYKADDSTRGGGRVSAYGISKLSTGIHHLCHFYGRHISCRRRPSPTSSSANVSFWRESVWLGSFLFACHSHLWSTTPHKPRRVNFFPSPPFSPLDPFFSPRVRSPAEPGLSSRVWVLCSAAGKTTGIGMRHW